MNDLRISGSVGLGGQNRPQDIKAVQTVLNQLLHLIPPTKALAVDGRLGSRPENSKTVAAIKLFQKKVVSLRNPDGRIDVNGKTHRKMKQEPQKQGIHVPPSSAPRWMVTAAKEIGQAEVSGKKANPRILEYFKASKYWGTDDSGKQNAWCASFVAWVLEQHGYTPVKNSFRAKEWENFGKKLRNPVYGAIGVKSRKGGGHVAFVVGQSADGASLYMLGGNQTNRVQVSKYPKSVWLAFVVPTSYDASKAVLPVYTKTAKAAGSED